MGLQKSHQGGMISLSGPWTILLIVEATIKMVGQSNKRKMQQHQKIVFQ